VNRRRPKGEEDVVVHGAGGLVWRDGPRGRTLAVIHRPRKDDWSLPKGKLEPGESFQAAAVREVVEETGCRARLEAYAGSVVSERRRGRKLVHFWHMSASEIGRLEPNDEVDRVEWLRPDDALDRLDHAVERRLVRAAVAVRRARTG
jgi:8-oxo-dGTP diphosphatase